MCRAPKFPSAGAPFVVAVSARALPPCDAPTDPGPVAGGGDDQRDRRAIALRIPIPGFAFSLTSLRCGTMPSTSADRRPRARKGPGVLRLALAAFAIALSAATYGAEDRAYLPAREGAPVKGAAPDGAPPDAAPPDAAAPVDWRRGVLGTEATDRHDTARP